MEASRVRALRFLALQVVGAVAVVHLVVGAETLAGVVSRGLLWAYLTEFFLADPRPLLFVLSALAVLGGVVAVARGRLGYRRAYALGIGVLAVYVLGWVAWHTVLDHGFALGGGTPAADDHGHAGLVGTLRSHYVDPLVAAVTASTAGTPGTGRTLLGVVSTSLELLGIALLAVLLRVDPAARREGGSRNPFAEEGADTGAGAGAGGSEVETETGTGGDAGSPERGPRRSD